MTTCFIATERLPCITAASRHELDTDAARTFARVRAQQWLHFLVQVKDVARATRRETAGQIKGAVEKVCLYFA